MQIVLPLVSLLGLFLLVSGRQPFTGDEPRYFFYALSFAKTLGFHLPAGEWFAFLGSHGLADVTLHPETARPGHSVVIPILASPLALYFGLEGVRVFSFACAGAAVAATAGILRRDVGPFALFGALALVFLCPPVAPYAASFYSEAALAGLLALAWWAVRSQEHRDGFPLLPLLLILAMPFFHLRLAPAGLALGVFLLLGELRQGRLDSLRLGGMALLTAVAAGGFYWYQTGLYGSLLGSATAPHPMKAGLFLDRLSLQLLELRHGLLAVAPAALLSLAGIARGLLDGRSLGVQAFVLALASALAFVWGVASESMPGRFWAGLAPVLAVGAGLYLSSPKTMAAHAWTIVLVVLQAGVTLAWLASPDPFINSRTASLVWDAVYNRLGLVHLGAVLPWDPTEFVPELHPVEAAKALRLAGLAGLTALCLALCGESPGRGFPASRMLGSLGAAALLAGFFWWSGCQTLPLKAALPRVEAMEADPSDLSAYVDKTLSIDLSWPRRPALVRLGCRGEDFGQPGFPAAFRVTGQLGPEGQPRSLSAQASSLVRVEDLGVVTRIDITPTGIRQARGQDGPPPFRPWNLPPLVDTVVFRFR